MPREREDWTLWQYTATGEGTKYGVARAKALDMDVFNGDVQDMWEWLLSDESEAVPEPAEPAVAQVSRDAVLDEVMAAVEALR